MHSEGKPEEVNKHVKSQITNLKQIMNKLIQELTDKTEIIKVVWNEGNGSDYPTFKHSFKRRYVLTPLSHLNISCTKVQSSKLTKTIGEVGMYD